MTRGNRIDSRKKTKLLKTIFRDKNRSKIIKQETALEKF